MIPIYREKDRAKLFSRLEKRKTLFSGEVLESVRRILSEVRAEGDRALLRLTEAFDGIKMTPERMCVSPQELRACSERADPAVLLELEKAIFNIHAYHRRQLQESWEFDERGVILGQRVLPLASVGTVLLHVLVGAMLVFILLQLMKHGDD